MHSWSSEVDACACNAAQVSLKQHSKPFVCNRSRRSNLNATIYQAPARNKDTSHFYIAFPDYIFDST